MAIGNREILCFAVISGCFAVQDVHPINVGAGTKVADSLRWVSGKTSITALPFNELRRLAGTILDFKDVQNEPHIVPSTFHNRISLPSSFDARLKWPKCASLGRIYEQGSCGACWALAGAAVISDRICIASKNQSLDVQLSSQDPLVCSGGSGNLCNGGYSKTPYVMYIENGLVTGGPHNSHAGCLPYEAFSKAAADATTSTQCPKKCTNSNYAKVYGKDKHYGSSWYAMGNKFASHPGGAAGRLINDTVIRQIQYELMTNGPMTVGIEFYEDFASYKSGVYRHNSGNRVGGHAMKLIGWGTEQKTDYWLLANSWGTQWGIGGFLKFVRGENHLGIEDYLVTAIPQPENAVVSSSKAVGSTPCDASTIALCAGKYGYSVHPAGVCTDEWCFCGWDVPEVVQCREGQSFDPDPSVYTCADTATVAACS